MEAELLLETIAQGESASVEFKRCGAQPEQDTFETVCAFANHMGGSVYLGVEDNGTVTGVAEGAAIGHTAQYRQCCPQSQAVRSHCDARD
jgi:ATP-dependent DNA helicase RecG